MAKKPMRVDKGIILREDTDALSKEGELKNKSSKIKTYIDSAEREVVTNDQTQTLENKTIDGTAATGNNTVKADASDITYSNATSGLVATTSQAAIDEVEGRVDTAETNITTNATNLTNHLSDASDAHDSSAISYDNTTSGLTATDAQAAIDEVEGRLDTAESDITTNATSISDHLSDPTAAHAASAIDYSNISSGLTATNVQTAIDEVEARVDTAETDIADLTTLSGVAANSTDLGTFTGTTIPDSSTNKAALQALETEVETKADDADLTAHTGATSGVHGVTGNVVGTTDTQTLTNKTLTSPDINTPDIDGGTASNTSRIILPKDTTTNLDILTDTEALIAYDTTLGTPVFNNGAGWTAIGTGSGGGGLDVFFTENHETNGIDDYTSGNNATFDNGGTLDGTLALDTTTPINGDQGLKYTMSTSSINDWIAGGSITVGEKQQENTIGFEFYYKYDGDDDDIRFVIYDATNSQEIGQSTLFLKASSKAQRFSAQAYVPNGVTAIKYGFQVVTGNNTKILLVDDITGTVSPFVSKDLMQVTEWESYTPSNTQGFGTVTVNDLRYRRVGDSMEIQGNITAGTTTASEAQIGLPTGHTIDSTKMSAIKGVGYFWRNESGTATVEYSVLATGGDTYLNVGKKTGSDSPLTPIAGNAVLSSSATFSFFATVPIEGWTAESEQVIAYNSRNASNSMVRLHTGNGHGSTNTKIRRFSTTVTNVGNAITYADSATDGASFTINEDGVYYITYTDVSTASISGVGLSLNSSQLTTSIASISEADKLSFITTAAASFEGVASWAGTLSKGDIIRPHTDGSPNATSGTDSALFTISKIGVGDLLGVPTPLVGYLKDVKSSGTEGGTFTSGSYQTRVLNTTEGDFSKFGTLTSNQFTLDAGIYDIEVEAPSYRVNINKLKLRNITDSSDTIIGQHTNSDNTSGDMSFSRIKGSFSINSTKTYEIQHRCATTQASNGLGFAASFGDDEIYTVVKITKRA